MAKCHTHKQRVMPRRRFLIASLLLSATLVAGCVAQPAPDPPRILFVCQFGTAKSAIAREVFKQKAQQRGIEVNVVSRGVTLEDHISPDLQEQLRADGIDTTAEPAMVLGGDDLVAADIVIRFNPLPPTAKHLDIRDWSDLPSVNDNYENARRILNHRIEALLDEIANLSSRS